MSAPVLLCSVCDKPTSTIWPGLCADYTHTPTAALDAGLITVVEYDFGLRDMSRRIAELEQQVRNILETVAGVAAMDDDQEDITP